MINLRLAEYKDGKFLRFLEIGNDFLYGGGFVEINVSTEEDHLGGDYDKDKTDPLKRFDGLFDGLTYGKGRFILIIG